MASKTVLVEMDEYRELLMLKGRMVSLEEYLRNTSYIDKDVVLAILGLPSKKEEE